MWDYDKLFAEGNVVGLKNKHNNRIYNHGVSHTACWGDENEVNWYNFENDELKRNGFEIQYIIRLDEHGNVVEKLFDRDRDMKKPMPKLEDGMFGKIGTFDWDESGNVEYLDIEDFIITNNRVLFIQYGKINSWGMIEDLVDSTLDKDALCDEDKLTPIEIYKNVKYLKNDSDTFEVIWRHPEYQKYLDSKSN